jgi:hypothetical protein
MKEAFFEHYQPTRKEFDELWQKATFVPDANVLLNIYRYSPETVGELLKVFEAFKDRLWMPHQVALEYHRNRASVITGEASSYTLLRTAIEAGLVDWEGKLTTSARHPHVPSALAARIRRNVRSWLKELTELEEGYRNLRDADPQRDQIAALFDGKVGEPYSPEELGTHEKAAEDRYKVKIPPGYQDEKKDIGRKYGDYLVWRQILDWAKGSATHLIFITDDQKDDWWDRAHGQTIGPRHELRREMRDEVGATFYMYTMEQFLEEASPRMPKPVPPKSIAEVRDVSRGLELARLMRERGELPATAAAEVERIRRIAMGLGGAPTDVAAELARLGGLPMAGAAASLSDAYRQAVAGSAAFREQIEGMSTFAQERNSALLRQITEPWMNRSTIEEILLAYKNPMVDALARDWRPRPPGIQASDSRASEGASTDADPDDV